MLSFFTYHLTPQFLNLVQASYELCTHSITLMKFTDMTGLETNGSQLVCRLVEILFWLVSLVLSLAILANENFKALKHRMETIY